MSSELRMKPRMKYDSWKLPNPRATRTPGSFCRTSPTPLAWRSWISSLV
ncbi:Uncharacterised protein [Bordetella pertussis]|nr:Uncharacterised protein [Bordetella pertussis]